MESTGQSLLTTWRCLLSGKGAPLPVPSRHSSDETPAEQGRPGQAPVFVISFIFKRDLQWQHPNRPANEAHYLIR